MFAPTRLLIISAALFASSLCSGANVNVTANSNLTFTPANVTINAGDTVTFTNNGGVHNVRSDDAGFRCASSCTSSGGNPSSANWTDAITFSSAGTFGFYCELHGAPGSGMHGSITVNAAQASIKLGGYLSGNWADPSPNQGGHGFQLEFTGQNNAAVAIWFVYPPDGGGQNWIFSQGTYDPNQSSVTLPALFLNGPKFPPLYNSNDLQTPSWGTLTFTFSDCNHGTASWNSTMPGYGSGTIPISRVTSIQGTACPQ